MADATDIRQVLLNWDRDREATLQQIMPAVYAELRKIAASLMRSERLGHTLQPRILIHEAYLRLVRQDIAGWKDRAHFFGIAARLMRQILVDHSRQRSANKRDGGQTVDLDEILVGPGNLDSILDLDDVLNRMRGWDERKLQVVELHYFGGLKAEEISEALELTVPTVRRDLLLGRAWLKEQFAL